jgi:selenocysteine-specific elongation factor
LGRVNEPLDRPLIIGTAGHVDHGKTALIRRLTGHDTDRLPEERRRGISIELGFAPFLLPSGHRAAVVDVPGHERFVRQMLAGATGMDLVLLVVAADEGVMPQTREHLDILELLKVRDGAVVLTKIDLVDEEWRALVADDVRTALAGTFLANAPIFPVSSVTGEGIAALLAYLDERVRTLPPRRADGPARLPIDRAFTVAGFGTVVTGTLHAGRLEVEDRLLLVPGERPVRVRGLEVHGQPRPSATAGQRVAVNLAGVERDEIAPGAQLVAPGSVRGSATVYLRVRMLPGAPRLRNNEVVAFHALTLTETARAVVLDGDAVEPGAEGLVRLRFTTPVYLRPGDRVVLRRPSPPLTIGGGEVLATHGRFRRRHADDLRRLAALGSSDAATRLVALYEGTFAVPAGALAPAEAEAAVALGWEPMPLGEVVVFGREATRRLEAFGRALAAERLRLGWPREQLRQRFFPELDGRTFAALVAELVRQGRLVERRGLLAPADHRVALTQEEAARAEAFLAELQAAGFHPPTQAEAEAALGVELVAYLVDRGEAVRVGEFLFHPAALAEAERRMRAHFRSARELTMATFRDLLGTSRRYALPLLEHFDTQRLTRRVGDVRVLAAPGEASDEPTAHRPMDGHPATEGDVD